jgi:glycosyltransferase involved in cell wall biosynthesis
MAETTAGLRTSLPVRVVHLIDGLGGGGSERWIWDIVRLSDPSRVQHLVVTIHPDFGEFVYSEQLRMRNAYGQVPKRRVLFWLREAIQKLSGRRFLTPARKLCSLLWYSGCYGSATWRVMKVWIHFRPDVIHVHTFLGFTGGVLLKFVFDRPLVHTVPCLVSQMIDAGKPWLPKRYAAFHGWVDCFFTGASRGELLALGVPTRKISSIQGVVDLDVTQATLSQSVLHYKTVREELGLSPDSLIALSVGRLHSSKGHLFALQALPSLLRKLPDIHWLVLGEGDQRAILETQARELGVEKHMHLLGFRQDPLPWYAAANIYLRTPIFEAENLSSFQAMAVGLPVVGFETGCETELLSKVGHGKLVPVRDVEMLSAAALCILRLPDKGAQLGKLGADYCRKHLDIHQTISEFSSVYYTLSRTKHASSLA